MAAAIHLLMQETSLVKIYLGGLIYKKDPRTESSRASASSLKLSICIECYPRSHSYLEQASNKDQGSHILEFYNDNVIYG